jgi:hypothetical protein
LPVNSAEVRVFLESSLQIERSGRYSFTLDGRPVDFSQAMPLPAHPRGLDALGNGLMGWALRLFYWLEKRKL